MTSNGHMKFANRLRALREKRGWSQDDLSKKADITQEYISMLEMGLRSPSFDTMKAFAKAFNMKLATFMVDV